MFKRNPIWVPILLCVILIAIGIIGGYYLGIGKPNKKINIKHEQTPNIIDDQNENQDDNEEINAQTSLTDKNIVNIETNIIYKVKYTECGHETVKNEKPTEDMIGLNRKEFENHVKNNLLGYDLELFSREEISLVSKKSGLCPNHFVVGEKNGKIAIFKIDENGKKVIHRIIKDQSIYILKQEDQEKLKKGIVVDSEEEAGQVIENFIT